MHTKRASTFAHASKAVLNKLSCVQCQAKSLGNEGGRFASLTQASYTKRKSPRKFLSDVENVSPHTKGNFKVWFLSSSIQ